MCLTCPNSGDQGRDVTISVAVGYFRTNAYRVGAVGGARQEIAESELETTEEGGVRGRKSSADGGRARTELAARTEIHVELCDGKSTAWESETTDGPCSPWSLVSGDGKSSTRPCWNPPCPSPNQT